MPITFFLGESEIALLEFEKWYAITLSYRLIIILTSIFYLIGTIVVLIAYCSFLSNSEKDECCEFVNGGLLSFANVGLSCKQTVGLELLL